MKFTDKTTQAATQRTITKDGFLVVPATISKVGVFDYLATELGLKEDGIKRSLAQRNLCLAMKRLRVLKMPH